MRRIVVLALVIVAIAMFVVHEHKGTPPTRGGGTTARDIPVVAARAHRGDIAVYITGLGAVTPLNTIAVKTRVDGQLMTASYKEGQIVRKGDPLVEIDSRPSVGPQLAATLFEGGRRRAQTDLAEAAYDASVAGYRQTALTAFQQVEDELAALRILEQEAEAEDDAVRSAQNSLDIDCFGRISSIG